MTSKLDQIKYFPVFIVKKPPKDGIAGRGGFLSPRSQQRHKLKDFYRSKDSQAEIIVGQQEQVLERVDTKYFCELFWALEPESFPLFIKLELEEIERQFQL